MTNTTCLCFNEIEGAHHRTLPILMPLSLDQKHDISVKAERKRWWSSSGQALCQGSRPKFESRPTHPKGDLSPFYLSAYLLVLLFVCLYFSMQTCSFNLSRAFIHEPLKHLSPKEKQTHCASRISPTVTYMETGPDNMMAPNKSEVVLLC